MKTSWQHSSKAFVFTTDAMIALSIAVLFMGLLYYFNLNAVNSMSSIETIMKIASMDEVISEFYSANNPEESLNGETGFCSDYLRYEIQDNSLKTIKSCVSLNE